MKDERLLDALKQVPYPGFSRDIVSFGLVKEASLENGKARIALAITTSDAQIPQQLKAACEQALSAVEGVNEAEVAVAVSKPNAPQAAGASQEIETLQNVKHCIAVASGKGGVGKSTVTANLACALARQLETRFGKADAVGVMDCDIYGPTIPQMLGVNSQPHVHDNLITPPENFGLRIMSLGFFIDADTPVVWRGPMVTKTIQQFATNVDWGELEILIVDLPPGTGDAHLTLTQTLPLDGAVIVTTPQPVAAGITRRGAMLFDKVNVPFLGVIENMSYLELPDGTRQTLFGEGGGALTAEFLETDLLAQIPLEQTIRIGGDNGVPIVIGQPDSLAAKAFLDAADKIIAKLKH